jgi:RNA polymerase sigma-70 factor (ECF subfamily)
MDDTRTSLLRRVADVSDQQSWSEFVRLYEPLLLRYVRSQGLNETDAQDVVQTVFVALLRRLPSFEFDRKRGRFRSWLWQLAHNAVIDWLRARGRHQRVENETRASRDEAEPEPDDEWLKLHRQRLLEFSLDRVKEQTAPTTWACFEMHLLQGKPGADVAAALGVPPGTVYVYASRILDRVRKQCAVYREEFGDD